MNNTNSESEPSAGPLKPAEGCSTTSKYVSIERLAVLAVIAAAAIVPLIVGFHPTVVGDPQNPTLHSWRMEYDFFSTYKAIAVCASAARRVGVMSCPGRISSSSAG
jgi:hypothetical protein